MFTHTITLVSLFSILMFFPARFANTVPATSIPSKPKTCASCQVDSQLTSADRLDLLSTLGRRTQVNPFLALRQSTFDGVAVNFVSTATGDLKFGVTDLSLQAPLPLLFQRTYVSSRQEDIGLGVGWSFAFNDRITFDSDTATLVASDGTKRIFRRDGQTQRFVLQVEEPTIHQRFEVADENTVTQNIGGATRVFRKISQNYYLSQITQSGGISIEISHDPQGKITRVTSGPSIWVALQWSEGKDPRLVGVADSAGRHVAFRQEGHRLRAVVDPTGAEWTYDYVND